MTFHQPAVPLPSDRSALYAAADTLGNPVDAAKTSRYVVARRKAVNDGTADEWQEF